MNLRTFLAAAILALSGVLVACPQVNQAVGPSVGRGESDAGDIAVAETPPQAPDGGSEATPIDPKTDPRSIGGGTSGTTTDGQQESAKVNAGTLGMAPLDAPPLRDARLRFGPDAKILAKSPPVPYVIHAKSATVSLSFTADGTWDPQRADESWAAFAKYIEPIPQLRAVSLSATPHQHVLYADADWTAEETGPGIYTFKNLLLEEGGELRFFMKETKTADFHSNGFASLDSDDPAKPFPSEPAATFFPVGSFQIQAVIISPAKGPTIQQNTGRSLPLAP